MAKYIHTLLRGGDVKSVDTLCITINSAAAASMNSFIIIKEARYNSIQRYYYYLKTSVE